LQPREIARLRMATQGLAVPRPNMAGAIVRQFGAMQAQEIALARWGIAMRATTLRESDLRAALDAGALLRTHILRPTWHFVAPADIRWILSLTGPRVHQLNGFMYRQQGLGPEEFARTRDAITAALEGGRHLTREESPVRSSVPDSTQRGSAWPTYSCGPNSMR
jgi:hypothetical protein